MGKIKIAVMDPTGIPIHEIETNYSSDQLDRFLSQTRIVIISDEETIHYVSKEHRWNPLNQNKEDVKID